jgi:membrane peptidoglycan carboxypeptidase
VPVAHGWNFRALEDVPMRMVPTVISSEDEYFFR